MAGRRPNTGAGRTRPLLRRTWPHPFLPTSLLENWRARTRTRFLVLALRVILYPGLRTPEHSSRPQPRQIKKRPGRARPRQKNVPQPAEIAAGRGPQAHGTRCHALRLMLIDQFSYISRNTYNWENDCRVREDGSKLNG